MSATKIIPSWSFICLFLDHLDWNLAFGMQITHECAHFQVWSDGMQILLECMQCLVCFNINLCQYLLQNSWHVVTYWKKYPQNAHTKMQFWALATFFTPQPIAQNGEHFYGVAVNVFCNTTSWFTISITICEPQPCICTHPNLKVNLAIFEHAEVP